METTLYYTGSQEMLSKVDADYYGERFAAMVEAFDRQSLNGVSPLTWSRDGTLVSPFSGQASKELRDNAFKARDTLADRQFWSDGTEVPEEPC